MKRALIEGTRIAQIVDLGQDFDVASPLYWVDVADGTTVRDTYKNAVVVPYGTYRASANLTEAVDRKRQLLSTTFIQKRDAGTIANLGATSFVIATTHDSQQELRELTTRMDGNGSQKAVTRSGTPIVFTPAFANAALSAVSDHHAACNTAEYDHLVTIRALTTIAEVDAYDVTIGWPAGA